MCARVLLNLLNELGEKDKLRGRASYRFSPTSLINSIIHEHECKILFITWHENRILIANFALKRHNFAIRKRDVLWTSTHNVRRNFHI